MAEPILQPPPGMLPTGGAAVEPSNLPPDLLQGVGVPNALEQPPEQFQVYASGGKGAFFNPTTQSIEWLAEADMPMAQQRGLRPIQSAEELRETALRESARNSPTEAFLTAGLSTVTLGLPEIAARIFDPEQLERMRMLREENPWISFGADVVGTAATLGLGGGAIAGMAGRLSSKIIGKSAGKVAQIAAGPKTVQLIAEGAAMGVPGAGRQVASTKDLTVGKVLETYAEHMAVGVITNLIITPVLHGVLSAPGKIINKFKNKNVDAVANMAEIQAALSEATQESTDALGKIVSKKYVVDPMKAALDAAGRELEKNSGVAEKSLAFAEELVNISDDLAKNQAEIYKVAQLEKFIKENRGSLSQEGIETAPGGVSPVGVPKPPIDISMADTLSMPPVAAPARVVGEAAAPELAPISDDLVAQIGGTAKPVIPEAQIVDPVMDAVTGKVGLEGVSVETAKIRIAQIDQALAENGYSTPASIEKFKKVFKAKQDEVKFIAIKDYAYTNKKMPTGKLAEEMEVSRLTKGRVINAEKGWKPKARADYLRHKAALEARIDTDSKLAKLIEERAELIIGKDIARAPGGVRPPGPRITRVMERVEPSAPAAELPVQPAGIRTEAELNAPAPKMPGVPPGLSVREAELRLADDYARSKIIGIMVDSASYGKRVPTAPLKDYAALIRERFPEASIKDIASSYSKYVKNIEPANKGAWAGARGGVQRVGVKPSIPDIPWKSEQVTASLKKPPAMPGEVPIAESIPRTPTIIPEKVDTSTIPIRDQVLAAIRKLETMRPVEDLRRLVAQGEKAQIRVAKKLEPLQIRAERMKQLQILRIEMQSAYDKMMVDRFANQTVLNNVKGKIAELKAQLSGARKAAKQEQSKQVGQQLFGSILGSMAGAGYSVEHSLMGMAGGGVVGWIIGRIAINAARKIFSPNGKMASAFVKLADKAAYTMSTTPMKAAMVKAVEASVTGLDPDEVYHDTFVGYISAGAPEAAATKAAEISGGTVSILQACLEDPNRVSKENTIRAVLAPNAMLARISRGNHTPEDCKVFQELYPETYGELIAVAKNVLEVHGDDLDVEQEIMLRRLTNPPTVMDVTPPGQGDVDSSKKAGPPTGNVRWGAIKTYRTTQNRMAGRQ